MPTVLDTYALSTLAHANTELGLTADGGAVDARVETLINRASIAIENALGRKILIRLYVKERHSGKYQRIIFFNQWPVLAVNLDQLAWDAATKKVTRADGGSFITDGFLAADKVLIQNSEYNSGVLTIATGGVAATTLTFNDTITDDAVDDNVIISRFRELWVNDDQIDEDDFEVNEDHIYYNGGFSEGHNNIRMTYYAGYAAIPGDIEAKCLELVKMGYEKNKGVKTEKLGPYSITFFDSEAETSKNIQYDLCTYMNMVI